MKITLAGKELEKEDKILRWFEDLIRMPPGCFSVRLSLAHPTWRRPEGRPRMHQLDFRFRVAFKRFRMPWKSLRMWEERGGSGLACLLVWCIVTVITTGRWMNVFFLLLLLFMFLLGLADRTSCWSWNLGFKVCQSPVHMRKTIIVSSYRMIPCHRDVSVHVSAAKRPLWKPSNEAWKTTRH